MNKLIVATTLAGVFMLGSAFAKDDDKLELTLSNLGKAANCTDKASPWRPWCIATDGWKTGKVEVPTGTLLGISVQVPAYKMSDKPYKDALSTKVGLIAFAVTGDKVKLIDIKPTEKGEEELMMDAVGNLSVLFKGKAKIAPVKKDLAGYIKGLKGRYKLTKSPTALTWAGENTGQLRKVGTFWVAIEHAPGGDPVWVSILTDAWQ